MPFFSIRQVVRLSGRLVHYDEMVTPSLTMIFGSTESLRRRILFSIVLSLIWFE